MNLNKTCSWLNKTGFFLIYFFFDNIIFFHILDGRDKILKVLQYIGRLMKIYYSKNKEMA